MTTKPASDGTHLVVLIHGFWGNPTHLNHLRDTLLYTHADAGLQVLIVESNRDNNTYDGIEVGAERITHEVHQAVDKFNADGKEVRKFSILGYSLGGLIARYVVGLLYADKLFEDRVQPVNFTTFASPHLGVRSPKKGYQNDAWNWLGSNLLSSSGQQLYLTDKFRDTGKPLLEVMADPSTAFVKGLKLFKSLTVYANIQHDPAVPFYSAAFSKHDPYYNLEAVDLHFLDVKDQKEQQVILDPDMPVSKRKSSEGDKQQTWLDSLSLSQRTRESLPFYAFATAVLPIGVPLFLANAGYQTYQSAMRVRSHETGDKIDLQRYRSSLFEESQRAQDAVLESVESTSGEQFLDNPPAEVLADDDGTWPVLALTPEQFRMVKNLDALGFVKYHCRIRVRRAHAAIVVRTSNSAFAEGKIACQHWASNFQL